jgi:hypothetical protein
VKLRVQKSESEMRHLSISDRLIRQRAKKALLELRTRHPERNTPRDLWDSWFLHRYLGRDLSSAVVIRTGTGWSLAFQGRAGWLILTMQVTRRPRVLRSYRGLVPSTTIDHMGYWRPYQAGGRGNDALSNP